MRNTVIAILASVLCACSAMMTGQGGSGGPAIGGDDRSSQQQSADQQLSAAVRSALGAESSELSSGIGVSTRSGVVTLSGAVASFDLRDRAVRIAENVPGVSSVNNQLRVDSR